MAGKRQRRSNATVRELSVVLAFVVLAAASASCTRDRDAGEITEEPPRRTVEAEQLVFTSDGFETAEIRPVATPAPEPARQYLGRFWVTGYDICEECCGKTDGITASGVHATVGRTVAAPREIPFGTTLYIEGIGERVVEDRGGLVTEGKLDVLCVNHADCYALTGWYDVYLVEDAA